MTPVTLNAGLDDFDFDCDLDQRRERLRRGRRRVLWSVLVMAALLTVAALAWPYYRLTVSLTPSLPHSIYLLHVRQVPHKGDIIAYREGPNRFYPEARAGYMKIIRGAPGDVVSSTNDDRDFFIDGTFVGHAKQWSLNGLPLWPGPTGVIPEGYFFVWTPHPDSFDSRYQDVGWIRARDVVGVARPLF